MLRLLGVLVAVVTVPLMLIVILIAVLLSAFGASLQQAHDPGTGAPLSLTACPGTNSAACIASPKLVTVAQSAMLLQEHTWGVRANMYDRFDPVIAPVYSFWVKTCGIGHQICEEAASGNLQCVEFVTGTFSMADDDLPLVGNGIDFWSLYQHQDGWTEIPMGQGWPQPGDIMVWQGGDYGHVAIVIQTIMPSDGHSGSVTVTQANAPGNRWDADQAQKAGNWYTMPLFADGSISTWPGFTVLGTIRQVQLLSL